MPTDPAALRALADMVERAPPSRELDAQIALAIGWTRTTDGLWCRPDGVLSAPLPRFTSNIHDAASLATLEWRCVVTLRMSRASVYAYSTCRTFWTVSADAPTEAPARTAAALRALAEDAQ